MKNIKHYLDDNVIEKCKKVSKKQKIYYGSQSFVFISVTHYQITTKLDYNDGTTVKDFIGKVTA